MSSTVFTSGTTITSDWLNDVNNYVYNAIQPVIFQNLVVISTSVAIDSGKNGMSAGPITISDTGSVFVPTGSVWTIV